MGLVGFPCRSAYGPNRKPFVLMLDFLNPIHAAVVASMNINAAPGSMPIQGEPAGAPWYCMALPIRV